MATPVRTGGRLPRPSTPNTSGAGTGGPLAALRRAAATPPGRLRSAGALLAALTLLFGALTVWEVTARSAAADQVVTHSQPLSQDAAEIYRSLADADTTAATGFLLAGGEPHAVRQRYQDDLANAARLLSEAAARTTASSDAQQWESRLNQQLPNYAGLVETARADDRQGLPLGGAYLRYASQQMQTSLLPAAQQLSDAETRQLARDYGDARALPWAAYGLALIALVALVRFQVLLFRRTNRVFNLGLLGATAATLAATLWLATACLLADSGLTSSEQHGATPLAAIDRARIEVLQSRSAETLNLVARGSTTTYADLWTTDTAQLAGKLSADGKTRSAGGQLALTQSLTASDPVASGELGTARAQFAVWDQRHAAASAANDSGDYQAALDLTVGQGRTDTADAAFDATDQQLAQAVTREQADFRTAADAGRSATTGLAVGAALLAALATGCALRGIGRRLAEYR